MGIFTKFTVKEKAKCNLYPEQNFSYIYKIGGVDPDIHMKSPASKMHLQKS